MRNKEMLNSYKELQEAYLIDIDMSGGMLLEFEQLNNNKNQLNGINRKD